MSQPRTFRLRDNLGVVVLGVVILALMGAIAYWLWDGTPQSQSERVIQEVTIATPPPPPPPEPKEEKIIEEEPVKPVDQPQPNPSPQPPSPTPSDAPPSPSNEAAGMDRLADAGSDSFHLSSGKGGGLFGRGGGGGGGDWDAAVNLHITRALQRDPRTRSAQGSIKVAVTMDVKGNFTSVRLLSSTGDPELDRDIAAVLSSLPPMGKPRPPGATGSFTRTINLKR